LARFGHKDFNWIAYLNANSNINTNIMLPNTKWNFQNEIISLGLDSICAPFVVQYFNDEVKNQMILIYCKVIVN